MSDTLWNMLVCWTRVAICLTLIPGLVGCPKKPSNSTQWVDERAEMESLGMPPELIDSLTQKATRNPKVTHGKRLKWRVLWESKNDAGDAFAILDVANLDADSDQELYLHNSEEIFEVTGKRRTLTFDESISLFWDYDGDGVDDLIVDDMRLLHAETSGESASGLTDRMLAYSLDGRLLGPIAGHQLGPNSLVADLDGDGRKDLFLSEEGAYGPDPKKGVRGFGVSGEQILKEGPELNTPYLLAGDIDGDGKAEVFGENDKGDVIAIGVDQKATRLELPAKNFSSGTWAYDFNQDGQAEIVSSGGEVYDLKTQKSFQLRLPQGYQHIDMDGMFGKDIAPIVFKKNNCVTAIVGDSGTARETLVIWDLTGALIYSEDFGERIEALRVAASGETEYLAVLSTKKLRIWP